MRHLRKKHHLTSPNFRENKFFLAETKFNKGCKTYCWPLLCFTQCYKVAFNTALLETEITTVDRFPAKILNMIIKTRVARRFFFFQYHAQMWQNLTKFDKIWQKLSNFAAFFLSQGSKLYLNGPPCKLLRTKKNN